MGQHGRICNCAITNHKSEIIKDFGGLIGGHLSTRHREVNRLLPAQTGGQPCQSAFFLELRAHRGGCAAGTRGELVDFFVDVFGRDGQILATGKFIQHKRTRDRAPRRLPLSFPELTPVNPGLARIHTTPM